MSGADVLGWALVAFLVVSVVAVEVVLFLRRRRRPKRAHARASSLESLAFMYKQLYSERTMVELMSRPHRINFATLRMYREPLPPNHDPGDEDRS